MKKRVKGALSAYGFSLAALVLFALGLLVVVSAIEFRNNAKWVTHTYEVLGKLDQIQKIQERASSEVRGYLIAGQTENLAGFGAAERELKRELEQLPALVADNPPQQARATQLRTLVLERLALAHESIQAFELHNTMGAAVNVPKVNSVQARSNEMIDAMHAVEAKLLAKRAERSNQAFIAVIGGAVLGIPFSLLMMAYTYSMLRRENRDRRTAEELAASVNQELNLSLVQLHKLSVDLRFLSDYAGMLQSAATVTELYEITEQALRGLLPHLSGNVFIIRASRDHAEVAVRWGNHAAANDSAPVPNDCWAIRRNQPYFVDDASRGVLCVHAQAQANGAQATACIPLSGHGEIFGWLYLCGPGPGPLEGINLAINACEQLSLALANMRLRDTLRHQAIRDPLTGLFNRRYLEEGLEREVSRCRRRNLSLAVLMLDLDHFKAFNDQYGHAGGDALLAAFARLLEAMCRGEDIACRFGGEEFALVFPEASLEVAARKAEEIREATEKLAVSHLGRTLPRVMVSIGVAVMPGNGVSGTALLQASDDALYQAKRAGRNRVEIAKSER